MIDCNSSRFTWALERLVLHKLTSSSRFINLERAAVYLVCALPAYLARRGPGTDFRMFPLTFSLRSRVSSSIVTKRVDTYVWRDLMVIG